MPVDSYNPDIARRDLKYYIFDWDDNILRMPTYIHMERRLADGTWVPHLVSTALFSVIRKDSAHYRPPGGDWEKAFVEFRDPAERTESKFLEDARTAIDRILEGTEKTPPSFNTFRTTLREGRIFAIVTARGHRPESLRKGVELSVCIVMLAGSRARSSRKPLSTGLYSSCRPGISSDRLKTSAPDDSSPSLSRKGSHSFLPVRMSRRKSSWVSPSGASA